MTAILGISAFYHDSAAALVVDGEIVAAAQEERFSRVKQDASFPAHAIEYCLKEAGLTVDQLDYVGFYEKPFLKFERLLETTLAFAPLGFRAFLNTIPSWLSTKLHLPRVIKQELQGKYQKRIVFCEHHESHAASAFFPSPFEAAAILTVDGVGEWATAGYGVGRGNKIELQSELRYPHSPGLLYSAFTYYCGFRVNSGEYKLMGLAPYGEPRYADLIREKLVDIKADGSIRLDLAYFRFCQGLTMTSPRFHNLFGGPPRQPETEITQRDKDLAASIQVVLEEILLNMVRHVHRETQQTRLCMAGGVALNCVANGRILREGPFEEIWIQPAAGDAGGALGVAQMIWHQLLNQPRTPQSTDQQQGSFLGPSFDDVELQQFLDDQQIVYHCLSDDEQLCRQVAGYLAEEKVVGWFQGRMEFGPRALGGRSILADARGAQMQSTLNQKIKFRESFRPFAPAVLRERVTDYFDFPEEHDSPYMLQLAQVKSQADIPAVTHVNESSRLQTVDPERHGLFYQLIAEYETQTGVPLLINTSFNVRGEPPVCTPAEAWHCFVSTEMDVLVLEHFVILKSEQSEQKMQASLQKPARTILD
ncbi:carbamoyltransferase family protein [Gimesia panareensis]|uniref:Decarbamoylnovobiocin carbamoyltransferase n=1 Tax=Gimesia panareensis TaxID=2527978 RepID=A0A518ACT4_9PLAN|nr:carbamoyltransferase [Gimesia panareensis]QDT29458.1 Decarbamoylnovobiocin carbamoyltransferase [Gimesia panareensis]QDU52505.1 Decarbamoylnovobiocin carbamoyltransferase [Gimesia panareensis]